MYFTFFILMLFKVICMYVCYKESRSGFSRIFAAEKSRARVRLDVQKALARISVREMMRSTRDVHAKNATDV